MHDAPPAIHNPFLDTYDFQDEIIGTIRISEVERDLIDAPEFQRLFRTSQLGFVDLVYACANHTRGIHSIGCCYWAKRLVRTLNQNSEKVRVHRGVPTLSPCESYVIGIGALLHDISHGPYAHDIEKKSHEIYPKGRKIKIKSAYGPYEKHDDYVSNPVLYITLLDHHRSHIARILRRHSAAFWSQLQIEATQYTHLAPFVSAITSSNWDVSDILASILFHLLAFEKIEHAMTSDFIDISTSFDGGPTTQWGLGPQKDRKRLHDTWYQPYRHDIIGDTLSADLLDYLHRDARRLNIGKAVDTRILNSYVLVPWGDKSKDATSEANIDNQGSLFGSSNYKYRCAIDLNDYKRGSIRTERLNDLFRLLDLRYEIHEKAVFHRVTQSAIAMSSRALLTLPAAARPTLAEMYGFDGKMSPALCGEDRFLELLLNADREHGSADSDPKHSQGLAAKLAERRVYRPLIVIPGDRVRTLLKNLGELPGATDTFEHVLRELAAIIDSEYFKPFFCFISKCIEDVLNHATDITDVDSYISRHVADGASHLCIPNPPKRVIFWVTPYKQLHKDPAILVCVDTEVTTLDALQSHSHESLKKRVSAGMVDTELKYASMWKMYVFLSDGLFYSGTLAKLLDSPCAKDIAAHQTHLEFAQEMIIRSLRTAWSRWVYSEKTIDLAAQINSDDLQSLCREFTSKTQAADLTKLRHDIATASVSNYAHGPNSKGELVGHCRDVRYKYSDSVFTDYETVVKDCGLPSEKETLIIQALKVSKVEAKAFTVEECMEIVGRMSASPSRLRECFQRAAARDGGELDKAIIQAIWRDPEAK